jgi:ABC-type phosphate transport system substrate-binding protein
VRLKGIAAGIIATGVLALAAVGASAQNINGAGATFPNPIYTKWFSEYNQLHPSVKINYQSIGSGGGIRQVSEGTVDFGASDGPMTDQQLQSAKVKVMHIPTVLGAVVPVYNIPGINKELNFSGDVIADIYLGTISKWNDPRIAKDNPGANLPDKAILPVYRSDGSGTTYIRLSFEGQLRLGRQSGQEYLSQVAHRDRSEGQRGSRRDGSPVTLFLRLRRTDLCSVEQDVVWFGTQRSRQVPEGVDGRCYCRCCSSREDDAR